MLRYQIIMLSLYLFVFAFSFISETHRVFAAEPTLETVIESTTNFFEKLKHDYESQPASPDLYESIDKQIAEYARKVKKSTNSLRGKRQLDSDKDIGILSGFENVPNLDLPKAIDITFFRHRNGPEELWYVAALNTSGISLLQYQDRSFGEVGFYDLRNGTRLISHSCESATLLVVQRSIGDVLVIRLSHENPNKTLVKVQTLDIPAATHSTLWRGMKEIYLAVAAPKNLTIFKWLGEHFDRIQINDLGAKKLLPFQTGGSMHLIAMDGPRTSILKFLLHSDEFVVIQKLVGAKDATAFHLEMGHLGEHFLALAGQHSTVIYKQSRHRFVPFQQIAGAEEIRSLTYDAAILLLLIKNGEITIYQYDGWRFIESSIRSFGILDVFPVSLKSDELLAVRLKDSQFENLIINDRNNSDINGTNEWSRKSIDENNFAKDDITMSSWSFRRITLRRRKTLKSLREETKIWCDESLEKTLRIVAAVPKFDGCVTIGNGYIKNLRVREVNSRSVEKFAELTERWNVIVDETKRQKNAVKNYISTVNPTFDNLRAATVRVNCTTKCRAMKTETAVKNTFLEHFRRVDRIYQNLDFRNVRVSFANNLLCPIPSLTFRDAEVSGDVNGINFEALLRDALMTTGNQQLTGSHIFTELRATKAQVPLDIATDYTRQDISAKTVKIDELNINSGGLLLPLNGSKSTLSGSITVRKANINSLIDMRGKITGKGAEILSPMIHIPEPLEISNNFTLRNMKIVENLEVNDLTRSNGKTFNEIISNAVPLNSNHLSANFKFRNDKVLWENMTLRNFPYKWVSKKHTDHVIISGTKRTTMPTVTVGKLAYSNLPTPRLPLRLCAVAADADGIWESNLIIDRGSAKVVKAINVFDESEFSEVLLDSATSLSDVLWSLKNLTGRITVKKANIEEIAGMDYRGFQKTITKWVEPGILKGPINVTNTKVKNLFTPVDLKITTLPLKIGKAMSMQNIYVGKLNGVDFAEFLNNIVKTGDTMSLTNVTFAGGLVATEITATQTSFSLQEKVKFGYLGSKEILGTLDSEAIIVPHVLHLPASNIPLNIVTYGNVTFVNEPKVVNVNRKNLERLYDEIWMTDRLTAISAEFVEFKNVAFQNELKILKSFDTPNFGSWNGIGNRLLSKTRDQNINVIASFASIRAPNVFGAAKSHLRSNDSHLNDLEFNSLKNGETQVIKQKWNFEELIISENVTLRGRINNLKLETDVVRRDVEPNLITGKKIVSDVTARNIDGLEFGKFASNAFRINNVGNRTIVIKGRKTFKTVEMRNIRVDGKIMGSRIENSLLKSSMQNLRGNKKFQGTLRTSNIKTNGTVNGIRMKYFAKFQLKKRAESQTIVTPIALENNLTIFGNVTIDGLYQSVELRNLKTINNGLQTVVKRTSELLDYAEGIDIALANRAVYWDKLELLEKNSTPLISDPIKNELSIFDGLGRCKIEESLLYCNDEKIFDFRSTVSNGSNLLQVGIVTLSGDSLIACVTSDPDGGIFLYQFDRNENRFHRVAELRVAGIIAGTFTTTMDCLWISLRLRDDIMILRYELWANSFHEWVLPGSGAFLMSTSPTEELLILRSDGVWKLGGLAGPRRSFHAALAGQIDTFSIGPNYYVQLTDGDSTTLLKSRYIGN